MRWSCLIHAYGEVPMASAYGEGIRHVLHQMLLSKKAASCDFDNAPILVAST